MTLLATTRTAPCWILHMPGSEPDEHFLSEGRALDYLRTAPGMAAFTAVRLDEPCLTVECAGPECGTVLDQEDDYVYHFAADDLEEAAKEVAGEAGWTVQPDGSAWCPECVAESVPAAGDVKVAG